MAAHLSMQLSQAGTSELVRSSQKDRFYSSYLNTVISDIIHPFIPQRYWLKWQREMQLLAEVIYYGLTTIKGNQTLGEEYCNTIQVTTQSTSQYTVPGTFRRCVAILIQIFGRYVLEKLITVINTFVTNRRLNFTEKQYTILKWLMDNLQELIINTNQLHLALFYLFGLYYSIGMRITSIRYLMIRYNIHHTPPNPYTILGWLLLIQIAYKLTRYVWQQFKGTGNTIAPVSTHNNFEEEGELSSSLKCALCFELCRVPTSTPCGHILCWVCCIEWVTQKLECPVCRTRVEPRKLVPLQHFEIK